MSKTGYYQRYSFYNIQIDRMLNNFKNVYFCLLLFDEGIGLTFRKTFVFSNIIPSFFFFCRLYGVKIIVGSFKIIPNSSRKSKSFLEVYGFGGRKNFTFLRLPRWKWGNKCPCVLLTWEFKGPERTYYVEWFPCASWGRSGGTKGQSFPRWTV